MTPISTVCALFQIPMPLRGAFPYGGGHIHDTFLVAGAGGERFILQRLNGRVFARPQDVMHNLRIVTAHLAAKYRDPGRRVLRLIPARSGDLHVVDTQGNYWRAFDFIEGTESRLQLASDAQARELGRAFGEFDRLMADLSGELRQTIPHFHDTPQRFEQLEAALVADPLNRAATAGPELAFAWERRAQAGQVLESLSRGDLPLRPTHNDAKVSNLLFDAATGAGLCVIDLDTVMPGTWLFDFGELVRSGVGEAGEERIAGQGPVRISLDRFSALASGFLAGTGGMLSPLERDLLVTSGRLMALENGVRFLSDYLLGDVYFKTQRRGQNLDRCRGQFALLEAMEEEAARMEAVVRGQ